MGKTKMGPYAKATSYLWNALNTGYKLGGEIDKLIVDKKLIKFDIYIPSGVMSFNPCKYCTYQVGTIMIHTNKTNVTAENSEDSLRIVKSNERKMNRLINEAQQKLSLIKK